MSKIPRFIEKKKPSKESLELIDDAIAEICTNSNLEEWFLRYAKSHRYRLAYDMDHLSEFLNENTKVIEFGAIPMILTVALKKKNINVTSIDLSPERYQETIDRHNLNVIKANIEIDKIPINSNTFDVALFNELFEHLRINPIFTLNEVRRVLKPGGILLLSTPNMTSLKGWYNLLTKNKAPGNIFEEYMKLEKLGHMGHVREYTFIEVSEFLKNCDYSIRKVIFRGAPIPSNTWKRIITDLFFHVFPKLRRYFSIVATK